MLYLMQTSGYNLDASSIGLNLSLADAVEDTSSSEPPTAPPTYDASLGSVLTTATGFVVETLEKGGVKLAISLLTQMVNGIKKMVLALIEAIFMVFTRTWHLFTCTLVLQSRWANCSAPRRRTGMLPFTHVF